MDVTRLRSLLNGSSQLFDELNPAPIVKLGSPVLAPIPGPVLGPAPQLMEAVSLFTITGLTPLMLMTVEAFRLIIQPQTSFPIPASTVWIHSQLLAPAAAANEYVGLTISSGTITFSVAPTLAAGKLTMASVCTVQVHLALQPPAATANAASLFGGDARALALQLPATFDYHFDTQGAFAGPAAVDGVGDTSADLFGQTITTTFLAGTAPVYDATLQAVLLPLAASAAQVTIAQSLSDWSTIAGEAPITLYAWALESTGIDVTQPTAAAGIGTLLVRCGTGLSAGWTGLEDGPLRLGAVQLFLSLASLLVLDATGSGSVGTQRFALWLDAQNQHGTKAEIAVGPQAIFQFASFGAGLEAVGVGCTADVQADRPVRVSGEPFPLRSAVAELVLGGSDTGGTEIRQASVSISPLLPPPMFPAPAALTAATPSYGIALRNALFKVEAPVTARLSGTWDRQAGALTAGQLLVTFRTLSYIPTLPDPYVASLAGMEQANVAGALVKSAVPPAVNTPWEILNCHVSWSPAAGGNGDAVVTSFDLSADPAKTAGAAVNEPLPDPNANGNILLQGAPVALIDYGSIWDARTPRPDNCALVDVSTNADLLGISFRLIGGELMIMLPTHEVGPVPAALQVEGLDVVAQGAAVHAFLLPQVSWEPLINLAVPTPTPISGDPPFPIDFYPGDGGPSRVINGSADTVALEPLALAQYLEKNAALDTFEGAALFTLPWGLEALARLRTTYTDPVGGGQRVGSRLTLPKVSFGSGLQAALSFQLTAGAAISADVSPTFMGATVQRNNVLDGAGNANGGSTLGGTVTKIFNQQFFTDNVGLDGNNGVPLSRIDLSGYGASSFSNWLDPTAVIASTSQAQFELMMGRCAHELVQVESLMYPWGIKVVRTITLLRAPSGYTYRHDSGWRADGFGKFLFHYYIKQVAPAPTSVFTADYDIHPGAVLGLYDNNNIVETSDVTEFTGTMFIPSGGIMVNADGTQATVPEGGVTVRIELQPVYFDANVQLEGFVAGAKDRGMGVFVTPSSGILGFVQISPFGIPLTADALAELVARQGSIGGPLNCLLQAGGSAQQMRVSGFDFNNAIADDGHAVFSLAVRHTVVLPKEGAWAVVRHDAATGVVRPLPDGMTVPLIRAGLMTLDAADDLVLAIDKTTTLLRFADPQEVERQPAANTVNYGLLFTTDTQKALFLTPGFVAGRTDMLSKTPPLFADAFRVARSKAVFPNIGDAITDFGDAISLLHDGTEFATTTAMDVTKAALSLLDTAADQGFNLLKKVADFSLPDTECTLLEFGGAFKLYIEYQATPGAGNPAGRLDFNINSAAAAVEDKWKSVMNGVAIVVDLGPLDRLVTIKGSWNANNGAEAQYGGIISPTPELVFSEDLRPVIDLLQILQELQGDDYKDAVKDGLKLAMGNKADSWEYKLAADKEIPLVHFPPPDVPSPPLILDASLKVGLYLNESIQITTDANQLLPSAGGYLNFFGRLSVECFSVGLAAIYAVGQANLNIAADTAKGPSLDMMFGFGAQVVASIPVVGNVSVLFVVGVEIYLDKTTLSITASMLFQGKADLLEGLVSVTITIEAKGTITRSPLIGDGGKTTLAAQVTFALDISIFLVIDISFSKSWQEQRQVA